jgi:hypothetical protein
MGEMGENLATAAADGYHPHPIPVSNYPVFSELWAWFGCKNKILNKLFAEIRF